MDQWFSNCGGFKPHHNLDDLRSGIKAGLIDTQDEYGMTALALAVCSHWTEGVMELLRAGANTEIRDYRTGSTALYDAALNKDKAMAALLVSAGANPDSPNHWGVTPRRWLPEAFSNVPILQMPLPEPRIQNAEHLADHHHPHFEIPTLKERVSLQPGQAVDVYVYGPKSESKRDQVKVRITSRTSGGRYTRYVANVETPLEQTHLAPGMETVEFGPENVATVWLAANS